LIGRQDITQKREVCPSGEECRNNSIPGGILTYLFVHAFFTDILESKMSSF